MVITAEWKKGYPRKIKIFFGRGVRFFNLQVSYQKKLDYGAIYVDYQGGPGKNVEIDERGTVREYTHDA
jgi:hypothetical protein